jgi:hypothetical protein
MGGNIVADFVHSINTKYKPDKIIGFTTIWAKQKKQVVCKQSKTALLVLKKHVLMNLFIPQNTMCELRVGVGI